MSGNGSQPDGDGPGEEEGTYRLETVTKILSLIYALAVLLYFLWAMVPDHRKRLWAMRAAETMRRATGTLAFRTGHRAMAHEIGSGVENYTLPYLLSRARDKAGQVYERLRYTA